MLFIWFGYMKLLKENNFIQERNVGGEGEKFIRILFLGLERKQMS